MPLIALKPFANHITRFCRIADRLQPESLQRYVNGEKWSTADELPLANHEGYTASARQY